jgi:hypothetical protein
MHCEPAMSTGSSLQIMWIYIRKLADGLSLCGTHAFDLDINAS